MWRLFLFIASVSSLAYEVHEHLDERPHNPFQPCKYLQKKPEPVCEADHESYVETAQQDTFCEQHCNSSWELPDDAALRNCICSTGYDRKWYPDGPCIPHLDCGSKPSEETYVEE